MDSGPEFQDLVHQYLDSLYNYAHVLARRDAAGVRLITRAGNDFSSRFPFIAIVVGKLPVRSCLIDGEAIVCDENGLAVFDLARRHGALASAVHCAFDLLELDGRDLRREPD